MTERRRPRKRQPVKSAGLKRELKGSMYTHRYGSLYFSWNGGHGIHVYNREGREVDYFSFGDFSSNNVSKKEAMQAVRSRERDFKGDVYYDSYGTAYRDGEEI